MPSCAGEPAGHQWPGRVHGACVPGLAADADASRRSQRCGANRTGRRQKTDPTLPIKTLRPPAVEEYIPSSFPDTSFKFCKNFCELWKGHKGPIKHRTRVRLRLSDSDACRLYHQKFSSIFELS